MKKVMQYTGIITITIGVFVLTAFALDTLCDVLYWNTSVVDWFYGEPFYYLILGTVATLMANFVMDGVNIRIRIEELDEELEEEYCE